MYLKKVGSIYYFYARVPLDLIPLLGKNEIKKSLKTSDFKTAKAAAKVYSLDLEKLGMIARTRMIDDVQLHKLLQRYKDSYLLGIDAARDTGATVMDVVEHQAVAKRPLAGLNVNRMLSQLDNLFGDNPNAEAAITVYKSMLANLKTELRTNEFDQHTRLDAIAFIEDNKLDVELPPKGWYDPNSDEWFQRPQGDFLKIIRKLLQTKIDIYSTEIQRLEGNYSNPYDTQARTKRPPFYLSDAVEEFCKYRQREKPANERTQQRYREYFNVMVPLIGDKDVTEYTRQDLLKLKDTLYNRIANATKNPKVKRTLDKRTVETNYMGKISSLFTWLHTNEYIDRNMTTGLVSSLTAKERRERKRKPYDSDDLKRIFDLLPFDPSQPHLAWVPLIAAYSGCRQGEICQLLVTDIKEAHGIHYMHITEEDDNGNIVKTVKNENSRRLVPLHPVILDMGFLKYVELRKAQGKKVLFENQDRTRSHFKPLTGQYYSKLFQTFNRQKITDDPKKVFHSFRHLVHNELKQAGVASDLYHSITGHVPAHEMDPVYTEDFRLQNKYDALVKLQYSLDLEELKKKFRKIC